MTWMQRIIWPFYLTYMVIGMAIYTLVRAARRQ